MGLDKNFWINKKVFVTGNTGFKGSWLSLILHNLGAKMHGYALQPNTDPSMFNLLNLCDLIPTTFADIRDFETLNQSILDFAPDIIIHMAAQPLVSDSYNNPRDTYEINVIGTVNILECLKLRKNSCLLNITTDKCYKNNEWLWGYREIDELGGFDPYSSSKACSELVTSSFYNSFIKNSTNHLATARSGNVIGGGDWSKDRLIPDLIRGVESNSAVYIRNPLSTRPWQHVLEPLCGYLKLIEFLNTKNFELDNISWNFGPSSIQEKSVEDIITIFGEKWSSLDIKFEKDHVGFHEAGYLKLDSSKSNKYLNWTSKLDYHDTINMTIDWYDAFFNKQDMLTFTENQIRGYFEDNG
ncbi:hypothetical protein VI34_06470 [Methylophilales bacterium MBRSG12]|uniref:BPL/LPL catalytic domain-containing protein n=1 Tax=Methylophilales bacterium MBRS-H7 TaxID=1623450 RepID=A0A0H4J2S6_9PROT|nr:hypothetical protein UZ34_03855 [Methylophilales bacterium MBRSF5]AKO66305.1 hypothetical protein VI33_06480 [Methylophilales bacterium MBRS-H7]AKO67621.1 hypothetical protein VI34_06470 [Methylophilales bacterium MBRSG12]